MLTDASSMVSTAGALAALSALDPSSAHGLFATEVVGQLQVEPTSGDAWWGNPDDIYAQAWGWFATAMYANSLPDLWPA